MVGLVLTAVTAVAALALVLGINRLVTLRNRVEAAWADLDVQLARRRDLIPNLVSTVSAHAQHERSLFDAASRLRAVAAGETAADRRADVETGIDHHLDRLIVLAEDHPRLQSDERFRALTDQLVAAEDKIAFSRQLYNDTLEAYRTATETLPGTLLARPLGFRPPDFFTARPGEREPGSVASLRRPAPTDAPSGPADGGD